MSYFVDSPSPSNHLFCCGGLCASDFYEQRGLVVDLLFITVFKKNGLKGIHSIFLAAGTVDGSEIWLNQLMLVTLNLSIYSCFNTSQVVQDFFHQPK